MDRVIVRYASGKTIYVDEDLIQLINRLMLRVDETGLCNIHTFYDEAQPDTDKDRYIWFQITQTDNIPDTPVLASNNVLLETGEHSDNSKYAAEFEDGSSKEIKNFKEVSDTDNQTVIEVLKPSQNQ